MAEDARVADALAWLEKKGADKTREEAQVRYGITAMCVGLGQGGTVIWENPNYDRKAKKSR